MTRRPMPILLLSRSAILPHDALTAIEATNCPRMRDRRRRGWTIPLTHADDVIHYIEHIQRRPVHLEDATPELPSDQAVI